MALSITALETTRYHFLRRLIYLRQARTLNRFRLEQRDPEQVCEPFVCLPPGIGDWYVLLMATATVEDLRQAREAIVRSHADAEARHDVDATLATFHRPRYEVAPLGISDGLTCERVYFDMATVMGQLGRL